MSEAKAKDDLPIGKMMGETLRKRINGKMPPKSPDKAPSKKRDTIHTGKRG
jgi:hypothetical protein